MRSNSGSVLRKQASLKSEKDTQKTSLSREVDRLPKKMVTINNKVEVLGDHRQVKEKLSPAVPNSFSKITIKAVPDNDDRDMSEFSVSVEQKRDPSHSPNRQWVSGVVLEDVRPKGNLDTEVKAEDDEDQDETVQNQSFRSQD